MTKLLKSTKATSPAYSFNKNDGLKLLKSLGISLATVALTWVSSKVIPALEKLSETAPLWAIAVPIIGTLVVAAKQWLADNSEE
jgi:hypothetical protein